MKKVLLLFLQIFCIWTISESQVNYCFKTINKDNGLVDNYVNKTFEDSRGFIWVATQNGLCRYDGRSFVTYDMPQSKKTTRFDNSPNNITTIVEDNVHNLWIGTFAGVYIFNLETTEIKCLSDKFPSKPSPNIQWVDEIVFDKSMNVWIGSREGLYFYNNSTGDFSTFKHIKNDNTSLSNNLIQSICIDNKNDVWIGTQNGGIDKLSSNKKTFLHYSVLNKGINDFHIRGIITDSHKQLWVLTSSSLYCKSNESDVFQKKELINSKISKTNSTVFHGLTEDNNGNLWIASMTDGLFIYNPKNQSCLSFTENSNFTQKICSNSIQSVLCDSQGNMWLSSSGGGISIYNPMTSWFVYFFKTQEKNSLSGNLVSCFFEDSNGSLWVGTDGNGFAKCNKQNSSFEVYTKDQGLSSNAVLAICEIKKNILAIATWAGGLNLFNTQTKTFTYIQYNNPFSENVYQNLYGLYFDEKKQLLWCNTATDGIQIFDVRKMEFLSQVDVKKIFAFASKPRFSIKTLFDKDSNIWILDVNELLRFKDKKIFTYSSADSSLKITNVNKAMDLMLDTKGTLWANSSKGFSRYDKTSDCFHLLEFPETDLTKAFGLLEDSHSNIWITTYKYLFRFSESKKIIENLSQKWGMPEMQYFRKSTLRTRDGLLYFGGEKGFVVLNENFKTSVIEPKFSFTKLLINSVEQRPMTERTILKKDISYSPNIELPFDHNYITIEFAALNFIDNNKSKFKYLLKGFNDTWIETQNDRKVQLTNIPPGNYIFLLKTTDSEGKWIEKPISLSFKILPPWWKTLWFRLILIITLVTAIWNYIKFRTKKVVSLNKQLEELVDERTLQLQAKNIDLEFQKKTIQKQYEDIKENHFIIKLKNSQLQDALEMKDKLMTVIAHDFKNPLWSLQGVLKIIQKKVQKKEFNDLDKPIDMVVSSSTQLMNQMVSILDWSLGNDKTIVHIPINTNIANVVADVLSLVNDSASQKGIIIKTQNSCKTAALVDPRMINAVIRNVVINSIKFTEKKGKILINVSESIKEVVCEIIDNGKGMESEYVNRLLTNDELQAQDYQSGFGLMICKTFIQRNKGSLQIESIPNKGTTFRIYLPKGDLLQTIETGEKIEISEHSLEQVNAEMSMLIIDDNREIIGYLSEVFSDTFTVYGAYDGEKGLQIARNVIPDIILSDVYMPALDGIGLCKMIKSESLTCHIPIILISAKNLQKDQIEGLMSGADDYITKPFDVTILKQKVHSIIKNRKLLNQYFNSNITNDSAIELPESYGDKITKEATEIIIQNVFNPNFSVDSLAKQMYLSRSQLYRKFVGTLGQTPKEYILTLKFEKALEMLKTKKYRISDIAFELGFADAHYFSTCFAQRFGVSPSNYFPKE